MSTSDNKNQTIIKLALPKGRMAENINRLLGDAGIQLKVGSRAYRPKLSVEYIDAKILKPQNIVEMLHEGTRDIGFAGADWVAEMDAELVELLDTNFDPVTLVAAAPTSLLENGKLPNRPLVVASEYQRLTKQWIAQKLPQARFVRSYGATEVFPPEDADCIVDITQTGSTLRANRLEIVAELLRSSTRLYANPASLKDQNKRAAIDDFVLLLQSVLAARARVMVEVNVTKDKLNALVEVLPCMQEPTVAPLHHEAGYAVKAAVPKAELPLVIPKLRACGGTDIVITQITQIVP